MQAHIKGDQSQPEYLVKNAPKFRVGGDCIAWLLLMALSSREFFRDLCSDVGAEGKVLSCRDLRSAFQNQQQGLIATSQKPAMNATQDMSRGSTLRYCEFSSSLAMQASCFRAMDGAHLVIICLSITKPGRPHSPGPQPQRFRLY
jgi:hypothetical protein